MAKHALEKKQTVLETISVNTENFEGFMRSYFTL